MQTLVEEQVGARGDRFPGGELAGIQLGAKATVVVGGLFSAVQVIALLAATVAAVVAEQFLQLVEQVGLRAEMGEVFAGGLGLGHRFLHRPPLEAVVAVTLHHRRHNALPLEDVLEGALYGAGARSRGTGNRNDRVKLRHRQLSVLGASLPEHRALASAQGLQQGAAHGLATHQRAARGHQIPRAQALV